MPYSLKTCVDCKPFGQPILNVSVSVILSLYGMIRIRKSFLSFHDTFSCLNTLVGGKIVTDQTTCIQWSNKDVAADF